MNQSTTLHNMIWYYYICHIFLQIISPTHLLKCVMRSKWRQGKDGEEEEEKEEEEEEEDEEEEDKGRSMSLLSLVPV